MSFSSIGKIPIELVFILSIILYHEPAKAELRYFGSGIKWYDYKDLRGGSIEKLNSSEIAVFESEIMNRMKREDIKKRLRVYAARNVNGHKIVSGLLWSKVPTAWITMKKIYPNLQSMMKSKPKFFIGDLSVATFSSFEYPTPNCAVIYMQYDATTKRLIGADCR